MSYSYNLTKWYSSIRYPQILIKRRRKWTVKEIKRLFFLMLSCAGITIVFLGEVASWSIKMAYDFKQEMHEEQLQRLSLENQLMVVKEKMNQEVLRLTALHDLTAAQAIQIAQHIQEILDRVPSTHRAFFLQAIPQALHLQALHQIPASATVGMAIYESRYGKSLLAVEDHNYFGIKAFSIDWKGPFVVRRTKDLGKWTEARFRKFNSAVEGFEGFAHFLVGKSRYQKAFECKTGKEFVAILARSGYCPDPDYAKQVQKIIKRYHLDQLDLTQKTSILALQE